MAERQPDPGRKPRSVATPRSAGPPPPPPRRGAGARTPPRKPPPSRCGKERRHRPQVSVTVVPTVPSTQTVSPARVNRISPSTCCAKKISAPLSPVSAKARPIPAGSSWPISSRSTITGVLPANSSHSIPARRLAPQGKGIPAGGSALRRLQHRLPSLDGVDDAGELRLQIGEHTRGVLFRAPPDPRRLLLGFGQHLRLPSLRLGPHRALVHQSPGIGLRLHDHPPRLIRGAPMQRLRLLAQALGPVQFRRQVRPDHAQEPQDLLPVHHALVREGHRRTAHHHRLDAVEQGEDRIHQLLLRRAARVGRGARRRPFTLPCAERRRATEAGTKAETSPPNRTTSRISVELICA